MPHTRPFTLPHVTLILALISISASSWAQDWIEPLGADPSVGTEPSAPTGDSESNEPAQGDAEGTQTGTDQGDDNPDEPESDRVPNDRSVGSEPPVRPETNAPLIGAPVVDRVEPNARNDGASEPTAPPASDDGPSSDVPASEGPADGLPANERPGGDRPAGELMDTVVLPDDPVERRDRMMPAVVVPPDAVNEAQERLRNLNSTMEVGTPPLDDERPDQPTEAADGDRPAAYSMRDDPAWLTYHMAAVAAIRGRTQDAIHLLNRLKEQFPDHPASDLGSELLLVLGPDGTSIATPAGPLNVYDGYYVPNETPSSLARAEFILWQMFYGAGLGFGLCEMAECEGASGAVLTTLGLSATGIGSALYSSDGISAGEELFINSATFWATFQGVTIANAAEMDDEGLVALVVVAELGGLALGYWGAPRSALSAGDISLANTGGFWATIITMLIHGAGDFDADAPVGWTTILLAGDLGLLAGLGFARLVPMSRGRALLIDVGGMLGSLLGFALGAAFADGDDEVSIFWGGIAGIGTGLLTAGFLTADFDAPEFPGTVSFVPNEGGGIFSVGFDL